MELNRNHYFLFGLIVLVLGIQLRHVDTYVLNEDCSQFVSTKLQSLKGGSSAPPLALLSMNSSTAPTQRHEIKPPKWVGWAFISVGAVLILHALAMGRPD